MICGVGSMFLDGLVFEKDDFEGGGFLLEGYIHRSGLILYNYLDNHGFNFILFPYQYS